jgi:cell fate regulator YaaT (PSP1 superfamily)
MPRVVGVNFRTAGRIYSFDPGDLDLAPGELVVTETARGEEVGFVKHRANDVPETEIVSPLKRILRHATDADRARIAENERLAEQALELCRDRVTGRGLPMKLIRSEYAFDLSQVTIYFEAEGRVDFRELVKDLAASLRTRIQLHQVGARDAAKLMGGIGPCGRALCCSTWLTSFEPVSMKMAKEQSLFLNPTKFSGVCGKLMCCLRYEYDHYRETKAQMPVLGAEVNSPDGRGRVTGHNVIRERVIVGFSDGREREYPAGEIQRPIVRGCSVLAGGKCVGGCSEAKTATADETEDEGVS